MSGRVGRSVHQRRLASELKRQRELALLTGDEVAERLGWSPSKISRMENARIRLKYDDVRRLLRLYQVAGSHEEQLLSLLDEDGRRNWWDAYAGTLPPELLTLISFEAEAIRARNYEPMAVPGLLQTKDYALQIVSMWQMLFTRAPIELERRVEARMRRQRVLTADRPLKFWAVMDEAVLRRQIGERTVMRGQLGHLIDISRLSNVRLQILPLAGRHVMAIESFILLDIPEFQEVLCVEDFFGSRINVEDAQLTYQYALIFDAVQSAALSPANSRDLITRTMNELWGRK